jgi:hypothetical protein
MVKFTALMAPRFVQAIPWGFSDGFMSQFSTH